MGLANSISPSIQPKPEPPNSNVIFSCTFNTDGTLLFVVISDILVVYNADNGEVVTKPTRAGKYIFIQPKNQSMPLPLPKMERLLPQHRTSISIQKWPHLYPLEIQPWIRKENWTRPQTHPKWCYSNPFLQPSHLRIIQWRSCRPRLIHSRKERNPQVEVQGEDYQFFLVSRWTNPCFWNNQWDSFIPPEKPWWKGSSYLM